MSQFDLAPLSDEEIAALSGGEISETPGSTSVDTTQEAKQVDSKTETTVIPKTNITGEAPTMTDEEIAVLTKTSEEETDTNTETKSKKEEASTKEEGILDRSQYYKLLVQSGEWSPIADADGNPIEDLELDDEGFQELAIKQAQWKAEEVIQEREREFGDQYKSFVEFMKNGGKVEDLAKFEADQKNIESYDPTDMDQAEEIIKTYQEALGSSDKTTKKYIEFLKDQGAESLQEAAEEAKQALVKSIQEERETLIKEQETQAKYLKESQEKYIKTFKEVIYKDTLPDRDKKELEKFYFDLKHPIDGNRKASDYFLKVNEIQQDPAKFLKLVKFIKDFDSFEEKKETIKKTNLNTFNLIRSTNSSKSSMYPEADKKTQPSLQRPKTFDRFKQ